MPKHKKVTVAAKQFWVLYPRRSSDDPKKQQFTLADQENMGKEHYNSLPEEEKKGRPLHILPYEKRSAFFTDNRPIFNEMMAMINRGEVYGVIAAQFNRVSRNPEETGAFIQRLVDGNLQCFDAVIDKRRAVGTDSNAVYMLHVEGGGNWKDSKDKSNRVKKAMQDRASEGKTMGRKSFGFKPHIVLNGDGSFTRTTEKDEPRLSQAVEMFRMVATGAYSVSQIVDWAETEGVRARPNKKNPTGKLGSSTIGHILHDRYYKGWTSFHGEPMKQWLKEGEEPPVSEELWNRAQLALLNRCTNTSRIKEEVLRNLFVYGGVMQCGKCRGNLSPYKVAKKNGTLYVYYECKNRRTKCKVSLEQKAVSKQYDEKIGTVHISKDELEIVRQSLLKLHLEKMKQGHAKRDESHAEYKQLEKDIGDQLGTLKTAEEMGIGDIAKAKLQKLVDRRNELQSQQNQTHEEGSAWIEKVIRSFELLKMAEEILKHGSPPVREAILKAICSNYSVIDQKLVLELRSPFKQAATQSSDASWWTILFEARTEITETHALLEGAFSLLRQEAYA